MRRSIDGNARNAPGRDPVADNDVLAGAQRLLLAFEHVDVERSPARAAQAGGAFDPVDLVFLEEEFDALREAGERSVFTRLHQKRNTHKIQNNNQNREKQKTKIKKNTKE